jgi:hypothetical protein
MTFLSARLMAAPRPRFGGRPPARQTIVLNRLLPEISVWLVSNVNRQVPAVTPPVDRPRIG